MRRARQEIGLVQPRRCLRAKDLLGETQLMIQGGHEASDQREKLEVYLYRRVGRHSTQHTATPRFGDNRICASTSTTKRQPVFSIFPAREQPQQLLPR